MSAARFVTLAVFAVGTACSSGNESLSGTDTTAGPKVSAKDSGQPMQKSQGATKPPPTCESLAKTVQGALGRLSVCEDDSDCNAIETQLSAPAAGIECSTAFINSARGRASFDSAVSAFRDKCQGAVPKCPPAPEKASCVQGVCSPYVAKIIEPPANRVMKRVSLKDIDKQKWWKFGGTYWRMWGSAFTGSQPKGVSVGPEGKYVFVTNTGFHDFRNVTRFDPMTLKRKAEANFKGNAVESLVSPKGDVIWVSNFYHKEMLELDTQRLRVKRRFKVQNIAKHFDLAEKANELWIANWGLNSISVVDLDSGKAQKHIKVGKQPRGTGVLPDESKVYIANFGSRSVSVIDRANREVIKTIDAKCNNPRHIDVAKDGRVFVSCYGGTEVLVIDSTTDTVTRRIKVGRGPKTIMLSHDQRFAFTADYKGHTMSMIDLQTWDVLIVPMPTYKTSGLYVDPTDDRVYVTGWSTRNLMVVDRLLPGQDPTEKPGSHKWRKVCRQKTLDLCLHKFP